MMNDKKLIEEITRIVLQEIKGVQSPFITAAVSARHIHLSGEHVNKLFGYGYKLRKFKDISQIGQFACMEKVTLLSKGRIENVRVLGPERPSTQVEIAKSDARILGINPPIRSSGDIKGSQGLWIIGPKGRIFIEECCIIADRHIHFTPDDAKVFGVKDNQKVKVKLFGQRGGIMDNVTCKVREDYKLEMHVDVDDGNAFWINNGDRIEIIKE